VFKKDKFTIGANTLKVGARMYEMSVIDGETGADPAKMALEIVRGLISGLSR
jgi:hypothetical protein